MSVLRHIAILGLMWLPPFAARAQPQAHLVVSVHDEHAQPTPARVRLTDGRGVVAPLPPEAVAVMYGMWDHADGFGYQPDSSFYIAGNFSLDLPEGEYALSVSKGHEYLSREEQVLLVAGDTLRLTVGLERWIDMPARGWYSADDHIHVRRSPREDSLLLAWTQAEDVHVGVMLRMGDFWEIYYPQYAWGAEGVYQRGDYLLTSGQEDPRTPELGHALGMGMADRVRYRDEYYLYDKVFDRIHELGGFVGYAHQATTFHGYRGLMLDGLRGKVDVLELLQFCAPEGPLFVDHYYHMLDLGYRVTAVAGSDFPWCGRDHRYGEEADYDRAARIGNARFYVHVPDTLSYESWKEAMREGNTFVSSGPMLALRADGAIPGETLQVSQGDTVHVSVEALGHSRQVPLSSLEIVAHGQVLARAEAANALDTERLLLTLDVPVTRGTWIAARVSAGPFQMAHTTPIYVSVDGSGFFNPETVEHYLALGETYLQELEAVLAEPTHDPERQAWKHRAALEERIAETRQVMEEMRKKVGDGR